ncbi:MAG: response regulator [Spirochaetales bacterium]|nr:response regulator [Spirochaetales bacterium]
MNLLIVDDEALVREWFSSTINELGTQYNLIGTAADARQALRLLETCRVDLIFVDINMPGMDGLELIARISSLYPQMTIVMLSAFAEFQYAKTAMINGASDYLLKGEITKESLKAKIDEVKVICESGTDKNPVVDLFQNQEWNQSILKDLDFKSPPSCVFWLHTGSIDIASDRLSELKDTFSRSLYMKICFYHLKPNLVLGLLAETNHPGSDDYNSTGSRIQSTVHRVLEPTENDYEGCIGIAFKGPSELTPTAALDTAFNALIQSKMASCPFRIIKCNTQSEKENWPLYENFTAALNRLDFEQAKLLARQITETYKTDLSVPETAKIVYLLLKRIYAEREKSVLSAISVIWDNISNDFSDIPSLLTNLLQKTITIEHKNAMISKGSNLAEKDPMNLAIQFINDNFYSDISLQNVAAIAGLNPAYFSEKFHEICGETFSDRISRLRINKAKELLTNSSLPIKRIGELIGYPNPSYFNQIFQKHCGLTPGAFRKPED